MTYSTQLWDKIRLATPVVGRIPTVPVPQGSESVVIPLLGTSPTFYKVAQATAQDANPGRVTATYTSGKLATGQQSLTVSSWARWSTGAVNWTKIRSCPGCRSCAATSPTRRRKFWNTW